MSSFDFAQDDTEFIEVSKEHPMPLRAQKETGQLLLCRVFLCLLRHRCRNLAGHVDGNSPTVAPTAWAYAMRHAHSTTLALGECLRHELVVRTTVCRVRPSVSHADYHTEILLYMPKKEKRL